MDPEVDFDGDNIPDGYDLVEVVDSDEDIEDDEGAEEGDEPEARGSRSSARRESQPAERGPSARELELERKLAAAENRSKNEETEKKWQERFKTIDSEYKKAKAQIKQLAKTMDNPEDFMDAEFDRLIEWRDVEVGKYFGSRERAKDQQIKFLSAPQYAESLVREFKLKRSDLEDLKRFSPEEMRIRAMTIADFRRQEAQNGERNVKAAKTTRQGFTGGGKGGVVKRVKKGSDDHLKALLGMPIN